MSRQIFRWAALLQIGLTLLTGCHPTQPFFVQRDPSMANYIAQSMEIEYADVQVDSLPEATQAVHPFGPNNVPTEFVDLTLEDCIAYALQNTKIVRVVNGANSQSGSTSAALLSAAPGQMPSIYDPALTATTANTQPLTIDNQGNRISPRGASRANQVGGVQDALSEFDTQFSSLFGYNTTDRPRNVPEGNDFNRQLFQAVDANAQAALSKRLAIGTVVSARTTTVYSSNNLLSPSIARVVPSDYTVALELQATQPLMRGRGTLVNRIPVVLARVNEEIQLHDFEANIRNLVKSVEDAYWDLYCGYRALETAKTARDEALNLWRVAADRSRVGVDSQEQEAQARALYYQFESQITTSLYGSTIPGNDPRGLYGREQILREKMGWSATDGRMIRPSDEPTEARVHFDWNDVHSESLLRSVELRRQLWAIKSAELEIMSAKNQLLPQLDLTAFYRWLGVGDQLAAANRSGISFPEAGSNALEELTGGDYQELGLRVELTPQAIGKRRALAGIRNSQIRLAKLQEEMREKEMYVVDNLTSTWRNMESNYISIKDFRDQLQAHVDEIKIYDDQLREGVTTQDFNTLRQLADLKLRAVERSARAQLQYYQAICEYNKSLLNIHYWKGSLLDLNAIDLGEGAWTEKAYWDAEERSRERAGGLYFDYGYTRPSVVSAGPVESGGLTEGNISDPAAGLQSRAQGTPAPAAELPEDSDEDVEDSRPPLEPPTASRLRTSSNLSMVQPAGGPAASSATSGNFDWGGLGQSASRPEVATSSNSSRRSSVADQTAPTNSANQHWRRR